MAEADSVKGANFSEQIRKAYGHDVYITESALARLAARYEPSIRMEQITRTSPHKEPKGWRDQFMCVISTRRQRLLHRRDWRSRSNEKERRGHIKGCDLKCVAAGELISANKSISIPPLHLGKSCSINPVPLFEGLSTIKEHLSTARRSSRVAKEKMKQKKLRSGSKQSSPKKKREKMTYHAFQSAPAISSLSPFLAAQYEINPTCRPSVLERLVLKGDLLLSSSLRPDPSAENFGYQDPTHIVVDADETETGGQSKENLINFNFAVTTAFNVPITGLMFPPLERRVRVCLFDGSNFLGNVHVFPAVTAIEEEDEPWVFVNKGASRCLVQYSNTEELSLYIEVNVRYKSATEDEHREASEITCAWTMVGLPKNQADVDLLLSRSSSELPLLVGSMEHPVEVNTVHMPGRSRVMVKRGGELSALHLHWYKVSDFQKKFSRLLPEIILASNEEVPFLLLYRKAFLDALLGESSLLPGDAVFSPLLQLYPWMLNERGKKLQKAFKESWIARKLEWPPNTDVLFFSC
ncbi:hypothetical protein KC19_1G194500 [Ceratodon purpureus]|uniref:Uncharacterized protein n=1 Tax=Ceratodon purpureus TaxID=3225 RepID=A0A8T0J976_CERPU|nr:hypothetical protein KC19_1G194500 [Ceratodon purpureus]